MSETSVQYNNTIYLYLWSVKCTAERYGYNHFFGRIYFVILELGIPTKELRKLQQVADSEVGHWSLSVLI